MRRSASGLVLVIALLLVAAASGAHRAGPSLAALAVPAPDSALASERIYFVMTDRYADGDPANDTGGVTGTTQVTGYDPTSPAWWHGGDLEGLTGGCTDPKHGLERIKDLGFNAIWITPVVVNQVSQGDSGGYHGYWGIDFTRVDPHLGSDQDFTDFTSCAHKLGMKVILDVVVNHTGDIVQDGSTYNPAPYRDCHGKVFDPVRYVGKKTFPCMSVSKMPNAPFVLPGLAHVKKPAWLNDLTNYHERGPVDFSSCSEQCYEQGDVFGLDDLFTEKPVVLNGLVEIYASWIEKYKLDGFRVDTARHVNAGFWRLWDPKMIAAARSVGVNDFQIFGEVPISSTIDQSPYVRDRGIPSVLDFPFQDAATGYASGGSSALAMLHRLQDDDYYRTPDGVDVTPPTFLGNHDMGRAAFEIASQGGGLMGTPLLAHLELGYDLLYLMRGAPVVYYGDEVGMIGTGGDQAARQDMFPTQVIDWQTQPRAGSPPIGKGSSFDVTSNPIEDELKQLAALREANPALATGWTIPRYAKGGVLVVSRIDPTSRTEYLEGFNNGSTPATVTIQSSTYGGWTTLLGPGGYTSSIHSGKMSLTVPAVGAVLLKAQEVTLPAYPEKPRLTVRPDDLSSLVVASVKVSNVAPISVAFAYRRGFGQWRRIDVDTSPPFRGFIDPVKFRKHEKIQVAAVGRALDGATLFIRVVPFTVP
ncbi:MAG TPA: alpha-amylase family glycosyl hydrolase [Gaiellaceae bacterium]|nr:alpha-amylase family glycosyl hydrolase [Gaiellaceae bacterium]